MKKPFSILCGTVALLCLVSMFIPIVAPRYSAELYHPATDYTTEYFLIEDYYYAREYWSITRFMLSNNSPVLRLTLSVSMAMLLYWATLSFMEVPSVRTGIVASVLNLGVTAFYIASMLNVMGGCRPLLIAVVAIDTVAAVVVAIFHRKIE